MAVFEALTELEGCHAEEPFQSQRRDRSGVHARGLEHRREPQVLRQCNGIPVDAWNVEEDFAAARARDQSGQDRFGCGAIIGNERSDLLSLPAGTDHAPRSELSIAQKRTTEMSGRADPGSQKRSARCGEDRGVGLLHDREGDFVQRNDTARRSAGRGDHAAVADIRVREVEPRRLVVPLLCDDASSPTNAAAGMRDGRIPDAQPMAAAAYIGSHDVEAEEREARAIIDAGDRRGRNTVELADEETIRIDRREHAASARPGFQSSAAAQSMAMEISSGRIVRIRSSSMGRTLKGEAMLYFPKPRGGTVSVELSCRRPKAFLDLAMASSSSGALS